MNLERTVWFRVMSGVLTFVLTYGICAAANCWPAGPRSAGSVLLFFFCLLGVGRLVAGSLGMAAHVILKGRGIPRSSPV